MLTLPPYSQSPTFMNLNVLQTYLLIPHPLFIPLLLSCSSLSSQVLKHPQNWPAFHIIYKLVIPKSISLERAWLTCLAQCLDYLKCNMAKTFKSLPYSQIWFSTSLGDIFLKSYHSIPSWFFYLLRWQLWSSFHS